MTARGPVRDGLATIAAARYDPRATPVERLARRPVEAQMERQLMYLRIFPGTEAEYDKRHAHK